MKDADKNKLFRLAAVLYADNNYEVKPKTIYKKIIESVLIECGSKECSIHQIIDFAQNKYNIVFEESTIVGIITNNEDNFHTNKRGDDLFVCLTEKRRQVLLAKIDNRTIDYFISQFHKEYETLTTNIDYKDIIYRFLYEIYTTNTASFKKLTERKNNSVTTINIESEHYAEKEKEIINAFLHWDNADKNKAIFEISSYALEYCMITNDNKNNSIQLNDLRNKIFYLDTNIIYRALGINGENRKNRAETFLGRFKDAKEKMVISKSTEQEFKEGIKGHIDKIKRYSSPRISSKVFQDFNIWHSQDIYNFYHNWRIGRANTNFELFTAEIFRLYDDFKKKFNIEVDKITPYNIDAKDIKEKLDDYTSKISTYKESEGGCVVGSATIDAENILWIETKRNGNDYNIIEAKYFMVSTDQALRRWDYQRSNSAPTVLLPSQWLSILLRYVNRTDDDFKSFVSFLNIKTKEIVIPNDKIQVILAGISEITEDITQQGTLLKNIIENKINDVISYGKSYEDIFENAKEYAKTELEKTVSRLEDENVELKNKQEQVSLEFDEHKRNVEQKINQLENDSNNSKNDFSKVVEENSQIKTENYDLKTELIEIKVKSRLKSWKRPAYFALALIAILIMCFILLFVCEDWQYNYPHKLFVWLDNTTEKSKADLIKGLILLAYTGGLLAPSVRFAYQRLWNKVNKKEDELRGEEVKNNRR